MAEFQAGTDGRRSWVSRAGRVQPGRSDLGGRWLPGPRGSRSASSTPRPSSAQPAHPSDRRTGDGSTVDLAFSQDGRHLAALLARVEGTGNTTRRTSVWAAAWSLDAPGPPTTRFRLAGDPGYADGRPEPRRPDHDHESSAHDPRPARRARLEQVAGRGNVEQMAMSPDGRLLAATDARGGAGAARRPDGRAGAPAPGQRVRRWFIEFSGDGSRVATVSSRTRKRSSGPSPRAGSWLGVADSARAGRASTSRRTARHSTRPGPAARSVTGTSTETAGSCPRLPPPNPAARAPVREPRRSPHPVASSSPPLTGKQVVFFDVASGTSGDPSRPGDRLRRASAAGTPTASTSPSPPAARSGSGMRGTNELVARGRPSGRFVSGDRLQHRRPPPGRRRAVRPGDHRSTQTTWRRSAAPVQLGQPVGCVAAGPDNRTAIVLTGRLDASGFFVPSTPAGLWWTSSPAPVLDEGELGIDGTARRLLPGRSTCRGRRNRDGEVLVLDLEAGEPLRPPADIATEGVDSVTYSPDGARILASGGAASVALLDGETGLLLARVLTPQHRHRGRVRRGLGLRPDLDMAKGRCTSGTPTSSTPSSSPAASPGETSPRPSGRRSSVTGPTARPARRSEHAAPALLATVTVPVSQWPA